MTIKGRNRPRRSSGKQLDMQRFLAYNPPQTPTPPMMGMYRAGPRPLPPEKNMPMPMPFYDKTPDMPMPAPRATQRMPTVLPTRRPARPQGQFMMDKQGRPIRTVPFVNKTRGG